MLSLIVEDFYVALRGFKNNRGRTILSIIGIMIGITCVITVTTLGSSLKAAISGSLQDFNPRLMIARPNFSKSEVAMGIEFSVANETNDNSFFGEKYRKKIMTEVPKIKNMYFVDLIYTGVGYRDVFLDSMETRAVDYGWLKAENLNLDIGGDFRISDYAEGANKVIIGSRVSKWLFPEGNPIGKKILLYFYSPSQADGSNRMKQKSFEVLGVLEDSEMSISGMPQYYIIIPRMTAIRCGFQSDFSMVDIIANDVNDVKQVKKRLIEITNEIVGRKDSLTVVTLEELIQRFLSTINIVSFVLAAIAALSLLVGGIGIMNIMIVTVTERKKEIGICKAVGASKKNIISQFLAESVILTFIGSILGCIFGIAISYIFISLMKVGGHSGNLSLVLDINGMVIAIIVSVFIGIFFGLYPALQAAKLDPVLALEEE